MTVIDFDARGITYADAEGEHHLTWGQLDFLNGYRREAQREAEPAAAKG